jgi:predicted transport protein
MPLFKIIGSKLSNIKEDPFKLEKELQTLTETNLETLFGYEFVCSQFERDRLRIDTLAFDNSSKSFVIIEYKRDQSFSVVDQGLAYLSLMLNNKEVFLVEYNEKKVKSLKRDEIDWSQSKVIFLAKAFTDHQQVASGFKDLPVELWQVSRYDGGLIAYEQIQTKKTSAALASLKPSKATEKVIEQVKTYTEADIVPKSGATKVLYEELRRRVLKLDDQLHTHVTKTYISFRQGENWRNIFSVAFRTNKLRIELFRTRPGDVMDPEKRVTYIKESMQWWNQTELAFNMKSRRKTVTLARTKLSQCREAFLPTFVSSFVRWRLHLEGHAQALLS